MRVCFIRIIHHIILDILNDVIIMKWKYYCLMQALNLLLKIKIKFKAKLFNANSRNTSYEHDRIAIDYIC